VEPQPDDQSAARPVPLLVAVALVGLQALALVGFGVLELVSLDEDRVALAVTTALFFVAVGVGLGFCARGLLGTQSWARGPVVALDVLGVLTGFSFWGGETTPIAIGLVAVCAVTVLAVLNPATTAALADGDADGSDD